ncbi:AsmA-like C-terminal region-containing protein [Costertonia aggregata]|uniref:AsmA-like C-terminal region-containing protein n=1 Tax=Costertonia aggregata TaxID=343403 RepID=A0A7H9AMK0_9FLAO|nr:AsmA-like C-terminal region-containing protein [Costertonia aggregata]QLG44505.1 AsmA-like C-terminal region-containing protein [Costertonia aggregata]
MKKKILKVIGAVLLLIVVVLIAAPFFLEAKIGDIIKNNVNNNVNATLDFSDADLSLFSSFPNAEVSLRKVSLINKAPFEGDTLFAADEVALNMGIMQLFKGADEPISITSLDIDKALLHIKVDVDENANYDIAKANGAEDTAESQTTDGFSFNMESYEIKNAKVLYDDYATGIHLEVLEMNHAGTGDLSLETSELDTKTQALVSFEMDSTNYLNKNTVKLDALIGIDLSQNKYSFLKNEALVNQLPLVFDGFVKVNEDHQEVDISFKTPSSDFKNFLAVIPAEYSKNIENVKTTGNFTVTGNFEGVVDEAHIPKFDIKINSDNASFKYPDLPKAVRNVFIDVNVSNKSGIAEDTYIDIRKLSFIIDEDKFNMTSKITELLGNTKVNAHVDGRMNLANISKAYPIPANLDLKGMLNADITTAFDMVSIEKKQYENTKTQGKLNVRGFEYKSDEIPNTVQINSVAMNFNPGTVNLTELNGKTGQTDFNATGTINNLLGFMFNNEKVEGNFDLKSNVFALNDFRAAEDETKAETKTSQQQSNTNGEKIKIPSFLDANINATANTVLYDNLALKSVNGSLRIKDETATLNNMTSSLFDGKVAFNGKVTTKNDTPTFSMNLGLDQLQIGETFKALELFKVLAPVAQIIKGKLSSNIELSGNLKDDFTPDLLSLSGDVLANILTREISAEKAPILSALDGKLDFIDLKQLNLKELKTKLSFKDGLVSVKPFTINYKDIAINVDGGHTFDQKMNYKATLQVPAKYLGTEINNLIAKIDEKELESLTIPVTANIGGMYNSPQVTTDFTSGVKDLTSQLVEIQKQKLINQGKDKVKDVLSDVLSANSGKDSTKKDNTVKEVLGGILGNKSKKDTTIVKDSTNAKNDATKETAKKILGGLFGKKKDTVKKKEN